MIAMSPCKVCACPTRNVVENILPCDGIVGVPMDVYLCGACIDLMRGERMNEYWSFNGEN